MLYVLNTLNNVNRNIISKKKKNLDEDIRDDN